MGRELMLSLPPASALEVHGLISEAEEAIRISRRTVKAALIGFRAELTQEEQSKEELP